MGLSFEEKCDNFSKLINVFAEKQNSRFFDDSGEGHDMETDELFCEDVFGWLIPLDLVDKFIKSDRKFDDWEKYYFCAEWKKDGDEIVVEFIDYPNYGM